MNKAAVAAPILLLCAGLLVAQGSAPPDLLASKAYPEDLVKGLPNDKAAGDCWKDEADGRNYTWNKNGNPPIVQYVYKFRNTCKQTLTCTLVVASGTKLRDKEKSAGSWRPYKADRRSFTIKPGDVATITGTLEWLATQDRMPSMNDDQMPCWFEK